MRISCIENVVFEYVGALLFIYLSLFAMFTYPPNKIAIFNYYTKGGLTFQMNWQVYLSYGLLQIMEMGNKSTRHLLNLAPVYIVNSASYESGWFGTLLIFFYYKCKRLFKIGKYRKKLNVLMTDKNEKNNYSMSIRDQKLSELKTTNYKRCTSLI